MLAKMMVLILGLGACGAAMLAMRQAQLESARELAEARLRVRALEEQLVKVRAEIARHVHPTRIDEMVDELGPLQPIIRDPQFDPTLLVDAQPQSRS